MPSTVLQICNAFQKLKGIEISSTIFSLAGDGHQMAELYNKVGRRCRAKTNWEFLMRRASWTSIDGEDQGAVSTLLADNPDHIITGTFWDVTQNIPINGPIDDKQWQQLKVLPNTGPYYNYTVRGGKLLVLTMVAGHTLSLIYKSRSWLQTTAASGVWIEAIANDSNVAGFPDELMMMGLEAYWRKEKGMDATQQIADFEMMIADTAGVNNVKPILKMHRSGQAEPKPGIIVPITGYE